MYSRLLFSGLFPVYSSEAYWVGTVSLQFVDNNVCAMSSETLKHSVVVFRAECPVAFQERERRASLGAVVLLTLSHRPTLIPPSPPLSPSFQPSSPPALPFQSSSCDLTPPPWRHSHTHTLPSCPSWAASRLPLRLGAPSKYISLGWVAASYSMSKWSQLGHSLMNHFLWDTVRKSLSEFGASSWCSMKLTCSVLSVEEPKSVHMCATGPSTRVCVVDVLLYSLFHWLFLWLHGAANVIKMALTQSAIGCQMLCPLSCGTIFSRHGRHGRTWLSEHAVTLHINAIPAHSLFFCEHSLND